VERGSGARDGPDPGTWFSARPPPSQNLGGVQIPGPFGTDSGAVGFVRNGIPTPRLRGGGISGFDGSGALSLAGKCLPRGPRSGFGARVQRLRPPVGSFARSGAPEKSGDTSRRGTHIYPPCVVAVCPGGSTISSVGNPITQRWGPRSFLLFVDGKGGGPACFTRIRTGGPGAVPMKKPLSGHRETIWGKKIIQRGAAAQGGRASYPRPGANLLSLGYKCLRLVSRNERCATSTALSICAIQVGACLAGDSSGPELAYQRISSRSPTKSTTSRPSPSCPLFRCPVLTGEVTAARSQSLASSRAIPRSDTKDPLYQASSSRCSGKSRRVPQNETRKFHPPQAVRSREALRPLDDVESSARATGSSPSPHILLQTQSSAAGHSS
jgi:hypothetical protein